ncbi:DegV family protein [Anaeromicrobium sediminis]|uniref:Fatty acid-binding protein DegV n=1 Tax=Anaeromicrobium sediminis TaxID=1478221 RepID=A0A267MI91_9FIRM|nr:DegV family protein [Anaeromicrobium sediminis]PAB59132.1 fatty acid-binding protein DegV [Anaeromicrobium sediminis]
MAIKILIDSTTYMPEEIREYYDIKVIPLSVTFEDGSFKETEMDPYEFYEKLDKSPTIPKSSQPNMKELYKLFEGVVKEGDEILGIFMSSGMSGTYNSANLVKEMILEKYNNAKINLIDSKCICMQHGYMAISAAKAAEEGKRLEEVTNIAKENFHKTRFIFSLSTLEYLKKGGRIGKVQALLGTVLKINPILTLTEGKPDVFLKVRTKKKAIGKMVEIFLEDARKFQLEGVTIHHVNCKEEGKKLAKRIEQDLNINVQISDVGAVVGVHVGPGAVGIAYHTKNIINLDS